MIKLCLSFIIIIALAEISKRVNPQLGGILSGLPLGTGLTVYFISYEQGITFTMNGIPWGISGLAASIVCCLVYFLILRSVGSRKDTYPIVVASITSVISFLLFGLLLSLIPLDLTQATIIFLLTFVFNIFIINKRIGKQDEHSRSSTSLPQMMIRALLVGGILLLITGIAATVGSKWAVILTAFPSTVFPLLIVLQYETGTKIVQSVIQGFSYSISTLVVFYYSFLYLVPIFGLNLGFVMIYMVCVVYLFLFQKLKFVIRMK